MLLSYVCCRTSFFSLANQTHVAYKLVRKNAKDQMKKNILASIFVLTLAISNGVLAKGGGSGGSGSGGNAGAQAGTGTGVPVKDGMGVGAPAGAGTGSGVPVKDGTGIGAPVGAGTGTVVPRSVQGR